MAVHLINPSDNSFGAAVITPRWLFVLAAAAPPSMGDLILVDESLEQLDPETIRRGDVVGISVHTGNALRGYEIGRLAHERGANVVYGGILATLFPEEPFECGWADIVFKEMAMWRGAGSCWIFRQAARVVSTKAESSKETNFSLPAGT